MPFGASPDQVWDDAVRAACYAADNESFIIILPAKVRRAVEAAEVTNEDGIRHHVAVAQPPVPEHMRERVVALISSHAFAPRVSG
jgi:hypothetical protein